MSNCCSHGTLLHFSLQSSDDIRCNQTKERKNPKNCWWAVSLLHVRARVEQLKGTNSKPILRALKWSRRTAPVLLSNEYGGLKNGLAWRGPFLGPQKSKIRPNLLETRITQLQHIGWILATGEVPPMTTPIFYALWLQKWSLAECHFTTSCGLAFSSLLPMSGTFGGLVEVPLWSHCFNTIYHLKLLLKSRWGLTFHGFHQCQERLRSFGDSGNYSTIERESHPLPSEPTT